MSWCRWKIKSDKPSPAQRWRSLKDLKAILAQTRGCPFCSRPVSGGAGVVARIDRRILVIQIDSNCDGLG